MNTNEVLANLAKEAVELSVGTLRRKFRQRHATSTDPQRGRPATGARRRNVIGAADRDIQDVKEITQ